MTINTNCKFANKGEAVIFLDGRFNYQKDRFGKTLSKEPGTAGMAFVAVWQRKEKECESFYGSRGIERTLAGRQNLLAGCFALDAVLKEIKTGDWKSSGIQRVVLKTRDSYLYQGVADGRLFIWEMHEWMVRKDGTITERANRDLWEDMADTLNEYRDRGIKVVAEFLHQENYPILSTFEVNPITLALEASNGTDLMKDRWFEETFGGAGRKGWPEAGA